MSLAGLGWLRHYQVAETALLPVAPNLRVR
jgi:hypothetical protein